MLYEVAILEKPTTDQANEGQTEKLLVGPVPVIAENEKKATHIIILDRAEELREAAQDRLEVLVRPFVNR